MRIISLLLILTVFATAAEPVPEFTGGIERLDPALDALIAPDAKVEVLATGFNWSEGPVWKDGQILFSDVPENTVFGWKEGDKTAATVLKPSGNLSGEGQGSNGLAVDSTGHLILCQHGERRVARLENNGTFTVIADHYEGRRFNSPNDLVIAKSGTIYFTDPPYGLKKGIPPDTDIHGVYAVHPSAPNKVSLIISDLKWPNGIALSPDERTLYVAVSDKDHPRIMAYTLGGVAMTVNGVVIQKVSGIQGLFDARPLKDAGRKGSCDGLKVDKQGNIWTTGPGGVLVLNKDGKHLGSILTGVPTGNCAWGGPNRDTLYVTADMFLLRVKTLVKGL